MNYDYKIQRCSNNSGLCWKLRLFENGAEVSTMIFPVTEHAEEPNAALVAAYSDAEYEASAWKRNKKKFRVRRTNPLIVLLIMVTPLILALTLLLLLTYELNGIFN